MDSIILVPGAGGSSLNLKQEEIWPPTFAELVFGYNRTAELQDKAAKPSKILDVYPALPCYQIYKPLQDDLTNIATHLGAACVDFPYDWREDIFSSADKLASTIADCVSNGSNSVTLVCHSMGNLLARIVLECGEYNNKPWFSKIARYVGICGPHAGVPEILEYALGVKAWLGISAQDMKILSGNTDFAACYQCLPFRGKSVLFDTSGRPLDFYKSSIAKQFKLSKDNLGRALALQQKLNLNKAPTNMYYFIAADDCLTDEKLVQNATAVQTDNLGDGTVPLWSSYMLQVHSDSTPGDHIGVLRSYAFRQFLYECLTGGTLMPELSVAELPGVTLSVSKPIFSPNEPIQILILPDLRAGRMSGTVEISRVANAAESGFIPYQEARIEYAGPPVQYLRSSLMAPADSGAYRVTFSGSHATSTKTSTGFIVSKNQPRKILERSTHDMQ